MECGLRVAAEAVPLAAWKAPAPSQWAWLDSRHAPPLAQRVLTPPPRLPPSQAKRACGCSAPWHLHRRAMEIGGEVGPMRRSPGMSGGASGELRTPSG